MRHANKTNIRLQANDLHIPELHLQEEQDNDNAWYAVPLADAEGHLPNVEALLSHPVGSEARLRLLLALGGMSVGCNVQVRAMHEHDGAQSRNGHWQYGYIMFFTTPFEQRVRNTPCYPVSRVNVHVPGQPDGIVAIHSLSFGEMLTWLQEGSIRSLSNMSLWGAIDARGHHVLQACKEEEDAFIASYAPHHDE